MARPLRIEYPGALYHITSRGNARQVVFLDDEDRSLFLRLLSKVVKEYEWKCYSYCLMNNHYHLLIETPKANLSRGMHFLNSVYAQKHNERHERVGHLLQGRYHAVIVDKEEYLLEVCRYIVLNPVRAGMVEDPAHYKWSSYLDILNRRKAASFLDTSYVLSLFSQPGRNDADEYKTFVLAGWGIDIWSNLHGSLILGDEEFAQQIQERIGGIKSSKGIRKKERFAGRPELLAIFGDNALRNDDRNQRILEAHVKYGYTQREIARYLHLNPSWICRIIGSSSKVTASFEA
jgi:REP element-mobilizing transposase RayT